MFIDGIVDVIEVEDLIVCDHDARDDVGDKQEGINDTEGVNVMGNRSHLRAQVGAAPVDLGPGVEAAVRRFLEVDEEDLLHSARPTAELDALPDASGHLTEHPVTGKNRLGGGILVTELEPVGFRHEASDLPVLGGNEVVAIGNHDLRTAANDVL